MSVFADVAGQRFGRLVATSRVHGTRGNALWVCRCDCGNEVEVRLPNLRSGGSSSCGCLWRERKSERALYLALSPEYISAQNAKRRCTDPQSPKWARYGGRGIQYRLPLSPSKAAAVLIEALGRRPDGTTLDRIDNDGHYEIGNLRWATPKEQRDNQARVKQVAL